jgi:hypothetical protein
MVRDVVVGLLAGAPPHYGGRRRNNLMGVDRRTIATRDLWIESRLLQLLLMA